MYKSTLKRKLDDDSYEPIYLEALTDLVKGSGGIVIDLLF